VGAGEAVRDADGLEGLRAPLALFGTRLPPRELAGRLPRFRLPHQLKRAQGLAAAGIVDVACRIEANRQSPLVCCRGSHRQFQNEARRDLSGHGLKPVIPAAGIRQKRHIQENGLNHEAQSHRGLSTLGIPMVF
jgi:hypothetical protein